MSVQELRVSVPIREQLDWQTLERIDPWGQAREDARFAMLASAVMNAAGARKQDNSRFTVEDFKLKFEVKEATQTQQTPEQIEAMFRMAVAANNALWAKKENTKH
jgi:hypothetical protein